MTSSDSLSIRTTLSRRPVQSDNAFISSRQGDSSLINQVNIPDHLTGFK